MEFRLLGSLEVAEDGRKVSLGGPRARALLALLLVHRNEVVSVDRIVEELWAEDAPKTAGQVVRVYVSHLRKALEPSRADEPPQVLVTQGNGYVLRTGADEVDVDRFESLRAEGRRLLDAGETGAAAAAFDEALSLWCGQPLQEFAYETFAQPEIARLEELRLATLEDRFDARLADGHGSELVADLERLVAANPLRERLRAQLMLALYRAGRQADALETYQRGRRLLVDELGLEPGEPLRRLEARILRQDPELDRLPLAVTDPLGSSRPSGRRRIAVTALGIAVIAGVLIAATVGRGHHRSGAAAPRVAVVVNGTAKDSQTIPAGLDPLVGMQDAGRQLGLGTRVFYGGGDRSSFMHAVARAALRADFVIVDSTPNLWRLSEVTRRFPETRFFVPDSVRDPHALFRGQENVTGVSFDDHENGFLGGYLAALMTKGHQAVSAVGGIATQSVQRLIAGFKDGARSARPGIRVIVSYSGDFRNTALCARAANKQINRGSVVVFDVAGGCGIGALQAAGDREVWGLGVDSDLSWVGPQVLASVVKRIDLVTEFAIKLYASGRLPRGRDIPIDLGYGYIGLQGFNSLIKPAVLRKFEAESERLSARDRARESS